MVEAPDLRAAFGRDFITKLSNVKFLLRFPDGRTTPNALPENDLSQWLVAATSAKGMRWGSLGHGYPNNEKKYVVSLKSIVVLLFCQGIPKSYKSESPNSAFLPIDRHKLAMKSDIRNLKNPYNGHKQIHL